MFDDDLSGPGALAEAAACDGAQLFVFPRGGPVEAVLVLAPDRFVFDVRTENAMAWFQGTISRGLREAKASTLRPRWPGGVSGSRAPSVLRFSASVPGEPAH